MKHFNFFYAAVLFISSVTQIKKEAKKSINLPGIK